MNNLANTIKNRFLYSPSRIFYLIIIAFVVIFGLSILINKIFFNYNPQNWFEISITDQKTWKTYVSANFMCEIQYPSNIFELKRNDALGREMPGLLQLITINDKLKNTNFQFIVFHPVEEPTLEEYLQKNAKTKNWKSVRIAGYSGYKMEFETPSEYPMQGFYIKAYIKKDNNVYEFTLTSRDKNLWTTKNELFNRMLSTFRFFK